MEPRIPHAFVFLHSGWRKQTLVDAAEVVVGSGKFIGALFVVSTPDAQNQVREIFALAVLLDS